MTLARTTKTIALNYQYVGDASGGYIPQMGHDVLAKLSIAQHAYGVDPTTANMGHSLPKTGRTVTISGSATEHKHQGAANTDVVGGHCTIQKSNSLKNVDHAGARIGDTQRNTILTCNLDCKTGKVPDPGTKGTTNMKQTTLLHPKPLTSLNCSNSFNIFFL